MKSLLLALAFTASMPLYADPDSANGTGWDGSNSPEIFGTHLERRFDKLPLKAELAQKGLGWPGFYWANNRGGIAHRWRSKDPQNFKYKSPDMYSARTLSRETINNLSPAEKYDLYLGNYNYDAVKKVWANTSKGAPVWHGICHGVSPASLNHPEPNTVVVTNPQGIEITFFTSDIKALIANYYANEASSNVTQLGKRCFGRLLGFNGACNDVNPAAFHIVLTNRLGIEKTGLIADMDRYKQVWNHAIVSYETQVVPMAYSESKPHRRSPKGTAKRIKVINKVKYAASIDPTDDKVIDTEKAKYEIKTYEYILDVDSKSEILGGEWESGERPDFIWFQEKAEFTGYYSKLSELYQTDY